MKIIRIRTYDRVWCWHSRAEESSIACDSKCQILWKMALHYVR